MAWPDRNSRWRKIASNADFAAWPHRDQRHVWHLLFPAWTARTESSTRSVFLSQSKSGAIGSGLVGFIGGEFQRRFARYLWNAATNAPGDPRIPRCIIALRRLRSHPCRCLQTGIVPAQRSPIVPQQFLAKPRRLRSAKIGFLPGNLTLRPVIWLNFWATWSSSAALKFSPLPQSFRIRAACIVPRTGSRKVLATRPACWAACRDTRRWQHTRANSDSISVMSVPATRSPKFRIDEISTTPFTAIPLCCKE